MIKLIELESEAKKSDNPDYPDHSFVKVETKLEMKEVAYLERKHCDIPGTISFVNDRHVSNIRYEIYGEIENEIQSIMRLVECDTIYNRLTQLVKLINEK